MRPTLFFPRASARRIRTRAGALVAAAALVAGLAACGSAAKSPTPSTTSASGGSAAPSAPSTASSTASSKSSAPASQAGPPGTAAPTVSGAFDKQPTINVPAGNPPAKTVVDVVSKGSGPALKKGDLAVVDDYGRTWKSNTAFANTYGSSTVPDTLPVGTGQIALSGLDAALVGVPEGSRVLIVLPPAEGFGKVSGLPYGVSSTDTAVMVFDVLAGYAANAGPSGDVVSHGGGALPTISSTDLHSKPTITMPKTPAPSALSVTTLVQGGGPAVKKGQELVVQYVGAIWASGKEFDSSWSRNAPTAFPVGVGNLIPAWDTGLIGVKVGSRVMIVAPPAQGYGTAGAPQAGISGTDTLVFVIDVLGAYNPRS